MDCKQGVLLYDTLTTVIARKTNYNISECKAQHDSLALELRWRWSRGNMESEGANGDVFLQPSSSALWGKVLS